MITRNLAQRPCFRCSCSSASSIPLLFFCPPLVPSSVPDIAVPGVRDHPQLLRFKDSLRLGSHRQRMGRKRYGTRVAYVGHLKGPGGGGGEGGCCCRWPLSLSRTLVCLLLMLMCFGRLHAARCVIDTDRQLSREHVQYGKHTQLSTRGMRQVFRQVYSSLLLPME